jgi:hypothetical protein
VIPRRAILVFSQRKIDEAKKCCNRVKRLKRLRRGPAQAKVVSASPINPIFKSRHYSPAHHVLRIGLRGQGPEPGPNASYVYFTRRQKPP